MTHTRHASRRRHTRAVDNPRHKSGRRSVSLCGAFTILLTATAPACADSRVGDSQHRTVRDSAGIRIVENAPPDENTPLWSLAVTPDLVIESPSDGEFTLHRIIKARFLSDDRVVVHQFGFELLWFDGTGTLLNRGGGGGEGPAESLSVVGIEVLAGDSVVAVSKRPPSIKLFGGDGDFVRSVAAPVPLSVVRFGQLGTSAWAGISFGGESPPARADIFRELWHAVRFDLAMSSSDTLLALGGNALYGDGNDFVYVPGGPRGHFAVHAGVVVTGDSDTYELKVFGAGGELHHVIRNSMPNPAEARLIASARSRSRPAGATEEGGPRRRIEAPEMETAPAYDWVFVANDGAIWVRRIAGPDEETVRTNIVYSSSAFTYIGGPLWVAEGLDGQEWHVYDTEGSLRARALLPPRFRPTEITASRILGVWKDELGVESIRVLRLTRK